MLHNITKFYIFWIFNFSEVFLLFCAVLHNCQKNGQTGTSSAPWPAIGCQHRDKKTYQNFTELAEKLENSEQRAEKNLSLSLSRSEPRVVPRTTQVTEAPGRLLDASRHQYQASSSYLELLTHCSDCFSPCYYPLTMSSFLRNKKVILCVQKP